MRILKKIPLVILLISFVSITNATTYYVATNGNDGNNGSEQTPWKTIQKAANTAKAGDHVYIKHGTYYNNVRIANSGTADNWIVFEAYPGDKHLAILEGGQIDIFQKSYIRISGLKIQNAGKGFHIVGPGITDITISDNHTYNTEGSGIVAWGVEYSKDPGDFMNIKNLKILNNKVQKACNGGWNECITLANGCYDFEVSYNEVFDGGDPIRGGEGIDIKEGCHDGIIHGNHVHDLTRRGLYIDAGGVPGIGFDKPLVYNITVSNNIVHDNDGHGLAIMTEGYGDVYDVKVINNLFYNSNKDDGIMFYEHPTGSGNVYDITIANNTIVNNARNGILVAFPSAYGLVIRNNIAYGSASKDYNLSGGNVSALTNNLFNTDPKFVDINNNDFHLTANSPAVNAGISTDAPSYDMDGMARVGAVDIGAFEFGVSTGDIKVSDVSLSSSSLTLSEVGQSSQLTATIYPSGATNQTVSWDSSDKTVATVSSSGLVRAVGEGTTIITVTTEDGGKTATATVNVQLGGAVGSDAIHAHTLPTIFNVNGSITFTVDYETTVPRDIHVDLQSTSPDYSGFGNAVKTVNGKGTASITFTPANNPTTDRTYRWLLYLTEEGKNWEYTIEGTNYEQVVTVTTNDTPTSVNVSEDVSLVLAPNPVQDFVSIQAAKDIQSVEVYAANGSLLVHKSINSSQSSINTSSLLPGVYLMVVEMKDGTKSSMKIIK